jgi:hypothetical protein
LVSPATFSANLVFEGLQAGSHDVSYSLVLATDLGENSLSGDGLTPIAISPVPEPTPSALLPTAHPESWVYFVHSYAAEPAQDSCTTALVDYGGRPICAAVWQDGIAACQFHPEKSGPVGEAILRRWLRWLEHQ